MLGRERQLEQKKKQNPPSPHWLPAAHLPCFHPTRERQRCNLVAAHLVTVIASFEWLCTPTRGEGVFGSSAVRAFHPMVSPMTIGR